MNSQDESVSTFCKEMDESYTINGKQFGENGMPEWTDEGVGNQILAIFNQAVRDMSETNLRERMSKVLAACKECSDMELKASTLEDLFVLAFHTRDCRGGKGEKALFRYMFKFLFEHYPNTMESLVPLIPYYGYYKDYFLLLEIFPDPRYCKSEQQIKMIGIIIDAIVKQLRDDELAYEGEITKDNNNFEAIFEEGPQSNNLSLLAKYMPRKGTHFAKGKNRWIYYSLVHALFPKAKNAEAKYRHLIVKLTSALHVPEVFMCAQKYEEIRYQCVPSLCMNRFRKAFLNELIDSSSLSGQEKEKTGNRYPDIVDRVQARQNLIAFMKTKDLNGKQLYPHDLISDVTNDVSESDQLVFTSQWNSMKKGVLESLGDMEEGAINLRKLVPIVDVSGSMIGRPMNVAIAMGILISEINHPSFQNRIMTFAQKPEWITFDEDMTHIQKFQRTKNAPWGANTNIEAAMEMIYAVVEERQLSEDEIPDLIIFSDMQFDQSDNKWNLTLQQTIEKKFDHLGRSICGKPYSAPTIIYWNLRSCNGHAVQANTNNTILLSGFSPSVLKLILSGKKLEETGDLNPLAIMLDALHDERYNAIRDVLKKSNEIYSKNDIDNSPATLESSLSNIKEV